MNQSLSFIFKSEVFTLFLQNKVVLHAGGPGQKIKVIFWPRFAGTFSD